MSGTSRKNAALRLPRPGRGTKEQPGKTNQSNGVPTDGGPCKTIVNRENPLCFTCDNIVKSAVFGWEIQTRTNGKDAVRANRFALRVEIPAHFPHVESCAANHLACLWWW